MGRAAVILANLMVLAACTPQEARMRLNDDLRADSVQIAHARFPCHSPDLHVFGYRFKVEVKEEFGYGDICWDMLNRQWTWSILPEYRLSRLNMRK
jgi:hypothetical protein